MTVLAKASLVGAAGLAAYYLTTQLMRLRFKTWQDVKNGIAVEIARAKTKAREERGGPLTTAETDSFNQYFKSRMALVDQLIAAGESPTHFDPIPFVLED